MLSLRSALPLLCTLFFAALATPAAAQHDSTPAPSIEALMAPGVSEALATYRTAQIRNVRYDLRLDVTQRDTARGQIRIRFDRVQDGDVILDFRGIGLRGASANGKPIGALIHNGAHIRIAASDVQMGENLLEFNFLARIAPSGASVIRFHDSADGEDYLYTLLVPADANQLFPCFDQPNLKARVTFSLVTPSRWTAIANGVLQDSVTTGSSREFKFAETRPISTYLIAFAAGPWAQITRTVDNRTITMYVRASRAHEAEADTLIALNARAANWLEQYFLVQFMFEKLDFVLAPAFPFGGMEHPGAVFYNEDRFIFRERPTPPQLLAREATIYHEIAHLWFGDLVTMQWFDDLWLKEGFATYIAAKMQAAMNPASDAWKTFYLRNKPVAYAVDMTDGTNSVWQQLTNLDQAKSNYGPIVYNKAPAILKQLDYLVGDSAFRQGMHDFLSTYTFKNATWRDLLATVGAAANRSLEEWGEQYILRPGMPVVQQDVMSDGDSLISLTLHQYPARALSGADAWPIRTEVLLGYREGDPVRIPVEMTDDSTAVPLPPGTRAPAYVFANAGDYAYLSLALDPASTLWFIDHVGTVQDNLLRAMIWGSLWDLVRSAELSPQEYLGVVSRELPAERDEHLVSTILGQATRAMNAYLSEAQQDETLPAFARMLRAGTNDTSRPYGIRKSHLDALIATAGDSATIAYIESLLDSTHAAGEPLRAPTRWAIVTKLVELFTANAERRVRAEIQRDSSSDGKRRAFIAGAAHPTEGAKRAYFTAYFSDSTLNEDWATASLGAFNSVRASDLSLPYLRPALDSLPWIQKNRRIFFLGSWLTEFINGQTSQEALNIVQQYLAAHPDLPTDLRRKVLQATDELERTVTIRQKYAGDP